jgi:hypothetical protein
MEADLAGGGDLGEIGGDLPELDGHEIISFRRNV